MKQKRAQAKWDIRATIAALAVFAVAFGLYANTLGHDFVWDDTTLIVRNPAIHDLSGTSLREAFKQPFVNVEGLGTAYYRPFTTLSYALDYKIYGDGAGGFHLSNVMWNALACAAAFVFLQLLFGNTLLSLLSALLFASHPTHTEAVAWISGRTDVLATLWMLVSLCIYVAARRQHKALPMIASLVAFAAALLSKESAAMLPFIVVVLETPPFRSLFAHTALRDRRGWMYTRVARLAPFFGLLIAFLWIRQQVLGDAAPAHAAYAPGVLGWAALPLSIMAGYVAKLLLPLSLSAEYDAPIPNSFFHAHVIAGAIITIAIAWSLWRLRTSAQWVLGIAIFVLGIVPVLNIVPIGDISAIRFLYFPSLGVALIAGFVFTSAFVRTSAGSAGRSWLFAALILCVTALVTQTVTGNADWRNERTLFAKTAAQEPDNPRPHAALAAAAVNDGDLETAIRAYRQSLVIKPDYDVALIGLANVYFDEGRYEEALPLMETAVHNTPNDERLINNLGLLYSRTARYDLAIEQFERALQLGPGNPLTHFNLGFALLQQGQTDAARSHLLRAVRGGSGFSTANYYLAEIELAAGDKLKAARYAEAFLAASGGNDANRERAVEILRAVQPSTEQ